MSAGVFTPDLRVEFVKGWLTGGTDPADGSVECGDGTSYPLEVTLDQLAEIFYRVKVAEFTANTIDVIVTDYGYTFTVQGNVASGTPWPLVQTEAGVQERFSGYYAFNDGSLNAYELNFLSAPYSVTGAYGVTNSIRDIGSNERAIWLPSSGGSDEPTWNSNNVVRTAFSWDSLITVEAAPKLGIPYFSESGYVFTQECSCSHRNQVAVVDGRYFLGFSFFIHVSSFVAPLTTNKEFLSSSPKLTNAVYKLELSNGQTLALPLYTEGDSPTLSHAASGHIIQSATEWWPYAKGSPAVPVWDTTNGAKL